MKNEAIKKINSMGKVGKVLSTIGLVCVIIGLVFTLLSGIFCVAFRDFITVDSHTSVEIGVDMGSIGVDISDEDAKKIEDEINNGDSVNIDINGSKYKEVTASVDQNKINMITAPITAGVTIGKIGLVILSASLAIIGAMIVLIFARKLCKEFEICESPFSKGVIDQMTKLAYSLIPWAVLSMLASALASSLFTNDFSFDINVGMVVTVLIVFALTTVFKYGAILQQESDETL